MTCQLEAPGHLKQQLACNQVQKQITWNVNLHWKDIEHGAHGTAAEGSGAMWSALLAGSCSVAQAEEGTASRGDFQAADCHSEAILCPVA